MPLNTIASEYIRGHHFKITTLFDEVKQTEGSRQYSICNPTILHDAAILRLAILEEAITATNQSLIHSAQAPLYHATKSALSCGPADPFLWLTLFWLDSSKRGLDADNAKYLRLSYALGRNEGWIALSRNRLAIAVFEQLPADLSEDALNEFAELLDTGGLYQQTAGIFASASTTVQNRIIERLKTAGAVPRKIFAKVLYDRGLTIKIPNVAIPASNPWEDGALHVQIPDVPAPEPQPSH